MLTTRRSGKSPCASCRPTSLRWKGDFATVSLCSSRCRSFGVCTCVCVQVGQLCHSRAELHLQEAVLRHLPGRAADRHPPADAARCVRRADRDRGGACNRSVPLRAPAVLRRQARACAVVPGERQTPPRKVVPQAASRTAATTACAAATRRRARHEDACGAAGLLLAHRLLA